MDVADIINLIMYHAYHCCVIKRWDDCRTIWPGCMSEVPDELLCASVKRIHIPNTPTHYKLAIFIE